MFPTGCAQPTFVQLHWDDADALDRFADRCEEMFPTGSAEPTFVQLHWDDADALDRFADRCEEMERARVLCEEARALLGQSEQACRRRNEIFAEAHEELAPAGAAAGPGLAVLWSNQ